MDASRRRAEFETLILQSMEAFGFHWDGAVLRQSLRTDAYAAALQQLGERGELFFCACSRREIGEANADASLGCVGGCAGRQGQLQPADCNLRWQCAAASKLQFDDLWQGPCRHPQQSADVVLRRRDGVHSYQLAVVVDDGEQGVTEVVRGADLLTSTPAQILLQRSLGLPQPRYGHLPLLVEADGRKLAKSRHAAAIDPQHAGLQLFQALQRLRQQPPAELSGAGVVELWGWALTHWNPGALTGLASVSMSGSATDPPSGTG